jgi:hypothetical protein
MPGIVPLTRALLFATAVALPAALFAQATQLWVSPAGVHVRVPAIGLIEDQVLERLLDGRSVKVEMSLDIFSKPGDPSVARATQTCTFSFDLWEERFAVASAGPPPRSISHLRAAEAEAWCVDQLTVPLVALGGGASDRPFWIRLDLHAADPASSPARTGLDEAFSLERLIDVLSQRRRESAAHRTIEAGPLRLTP